MTWRSIARKDFEDAVQSRSVWGLSALFVLYAVVMTYGYAEVPILGGMGNPTLGGLVFFLGGGVGLFISITSIVVCYRSIAGERELGSVKLLLALPHTRFDVLFGKVVGRTGVLVLPLLVGLGSGITLGTVLIGSGSVRSTVLFLGWTVFFALAYVSIIVGISAMTGSTTRAATLSVGFFFFVELLWDVVPFALLFVVNGFSFPQSQPDWVYIVTQIPPSEAYFSGLLALLPDVSPGGSAAQSGGADAFYAVPELGMVVLVGWLLVPLAIGYVTFSRADL
ncbi:MAG: ABC transporter permease subunit [Halobacteriota archaeon]